MVACCSRTWKASTSPIVMTPTRPRSLTTGRWRMRFPVIIAAHSSTGVSGPHAVTGVVMTSATLVAAGSRRCATTRRRMSRSVKMPASRPPSVTTNPPMPRSLMSSAALSTVSPGFTEMTSLPFRARMSWTVGMRRYYRANHASATLSRPPESYSRRDSPAEVSYGAGSDQRRPTRRARASGGRRARDRRRSHGARRLLPGARVPHLDRVRGDDVRRDSVRDGRVQRWDGGVRLPAADPVGARRVAAHRAQRLLGVDRRGSGCRRRVPDRADAAVPDQWAAGGEYGAGRRVAQGTDEAPCRAGTTPARTVGAGDAAHGRVGILSIR